MIMVFYHACMEGDVFSMLLQPATQECLCFYQEPPCDTDQLAIVQICCD